MALISAILGAAGGFGKKVSVPGFTPIDAAQVQKDTIADNLAAQPGANKLAAAGNQFSLEELQRTLDFLAPGSFAQIGSNIAAQLRGEVSPDDTRAVIRNSSAAGFNLGVGGSQFGRNITARALYGSEAGARQQGFQNLMGFSSGVPKFDPASMFLTPQQRIAQATSERDDMFKRDLLANQIEAAPDPFLGGLTQMDVATTKSL